ncbi:hypothetical protein PoB_000236300 [Plakobranchus ocellatus]|uniref:Uncharacterized protein n=1 Tax=Plakobranchus ocellatus TaxID=259542 RepID=A0AAV3XZP2_9GAST|nr:hypothetical protein PoB_000236300 [Plakobranchus ocellatus]
MSKVPTALAYQSKDQNIFITVEDHLAHWRPFALFDNSHKLSIVWRHPENNCISGLGRIDGHLLRQKSTHVIDRDKSLGSRGLRQFGQGSARRKRLGLKVKASELKLFTFHSVVHSSEASLFCFLPYFLAEWTRRMGFLNMK